MDSKSLRAMNSIDTSNAALKHFDIDVIFMTYAVMSSASKLCPSVQGMGDKMEIDNPFHGFQFWFIMKFCFVRAVKEFNIAVPGLSPTDAVDGGISSCDRLLAVAESKLEEMTAALEKVGLTVPKLDDWFFQKTTFSESESESDQDSSGSGSGIDTGDEGSAPGGTVRRDLEAESDDSTNGLQDSADGSDNEDPRPRAGRRRPVTVRKA